MLRLTLSAEPRWLDLGEGVRVLARPVTTAEELAADARAVDLKAAVTASAEAAGKPDPFAGDAPSRIGAGFLVKVTALAQETILAWEGVGLAEGDDPAPVTPETVAALMRVPEIAFAFNAKVRAPLEELRAEGNGSAPSPSITSDAGASIAADAGTSTAPPGADGAPMTPTPPDPPTAPPPGSPADPASP